MDNRPTVPFALLLLLVLASAAFVPRFASGTNLSHVLTQAVPLMLVAAGQTVILITGGIDLAVGEMVTLATVIASYLMAPGGLGTAAGVLACLLAGLAVGLANGFGIARFRLPPFLMTLAIMFCLQGINLYFRPVPGGVIPAGFRSIASVRWGIVPVAAVATVALLAALSVHLRGSRFGLHLYAVGGGEAQARLAGVRVESVKLAAYLMSGALAALAGLFLAARTGTGDPLIGSSYAFSSIIAGVLGGASLFGGRGSVWGAMASALLLACLANVLNLLHVVAYWQWIVDGWVLILAVAVYSLWEVRTRGRERAALPADQDASA